MKKIIIGIILIAITHTLSAQAPIVIKLWPDGAPIAMGWPVKNSNWKMDASPM